MTHTLSFGILDDLDFDKGYGPIHIRIDEITKESLTEAIMKIAKPFRKYIDRVEKLDSCDVSRYQYLSDEELDPSGYYFEKYFDINDIVNDLLQDNYCCWNHFQKYYVIAFAIDYKTFKILSKDYDRQIINWKESTLKGLEEITL